MFVINVNSRSPTLTDEVPGMLSIPLRAASLKMGPKLGSLPCCSDAFPEAKSKRRVHCAAPMVPRRYKERCGKAVVVCTDNTTPQETQAGKSPVGAM